MSDAKGAELPIPSRAEQVIRVTPSFTPERPGPDSQSVKTAEQITNGLNSGADPEKLMIELVATPPSLSNEGGEGGGKEVFVPEQTPQSPEDKFKALLEAHKQKFALSAPNLEADQRYQEIYEELMKEWELKNPEPHKGKEELTDKEKNEWIEWLTRKNKHKETVKSQARELFQKNNQQEFNRYQKYGVYDSPDDDPRYQEIFGRKNVVQHELVKKEKHTLSSSPSQIARVHAVSEFVSRYPEVAEVYAAKDKQVSEILAEKKEREEKRKNQLASKTDIDESTTKSVAELGSADKETERDQKDRELKGKEEKEDLQDPEKKIAALEEEVANLRKEIEELKRLESQAGEMIKKLQENPQLAQLLKNNESSQASNNLGKLLGIILLILLASENALVEEIKKTTT